MALVGISTALLVNMLGQARIFTMAAREHLIPLVWARVSQRYGTPIAAQITMGAASGQSRHISACRCSHCTPFSNMTMSCPLQHNYVLKGVMLGYSVAFATCNVCLMSDFAALLC